MPIHIHGGKRVTILLSLILAGEAIFFLPFVLARIFRPTLLLVFDISNLELGTCFSVYGIVAMVSYFFGGPLADKFPSRNLIAIALIFTALGGGIMAMIPAKTTLIILYGYWGFTTIFLFWAALIRATREWGGNDLQGMAFGMLEGGRGLTAALLGSLALYIFSSFVLPSENDLSLADQRMGSYRMVILTTSLIILLCGVLVWYVVPKKTIKSGNAENPSTIHTIIKLMKMPAIWMQALIIVCAYVGYKVTDDYSLYANQVLGFDEVAAAGVGTMALWLRPVFAVLAGILATWFEGAKVIIGCFFVMVVGGLLIYLGAFNTSTWLILIVLATTVAGVYGLRGIYFAVMKEAGIPFVATGAAVGIMSIVGYTPEIFIGPLMGFLLDNYPGQLGHQYVFLVLTLFSLIGLIVSIKFYKLTKRLT